MFWLVSIFLLLVCAPTYTIEEKSIVIVTASYNNASWLLFNLNSVVNQKYTNFHLIYIDDCSKDDTGDLVEFYAKIKKVHHKITIIRNTERKGALYNQYHAIHSCPDDAIIIILDGDDWFLHDGVLSYINNVYQDPAIWLTYGQFVEYPSGGRGFCCPMPDSIIASNGFRDHEHIPSHLRTFYAWLFKQIKLEDLMFEGNFFKMSGDIAAMFPMIEMARNGHFKFISDILLVYNGENSLNDHKISKDLQRALDLELRSRPRYPALETPVFSEKGQPETVNVPQKNNKDIKDE